MLMRACLPTPRARVYRKGSRDIRPSALQTLNIVNAITQPSWEQARSVLVRRDYRPATLVPGLELEPEHLEHESLG